MGTDAATDFRVLGPLEVGVGGRPVGIGAGKQRALLLTLLLHRNETVPLERLIDAVWGETPPPNAGHVIQVYVSQLRKVLETGGGSRLLATRAGGYAIELGPASLDVERFEALVEQGRAALAAGDPVSAAVTLREAIDLWRGDPLDDVPLQGDARAIVRRLEEVRLGALEDRVEAELGLARHATLGPELELLVAQNPYRERFRGQLMLALYRSGRQAEALEVYRATRRTLVEELGIEPSAELQALEQAILRQDDQLQLRGPPHRPRGDGRPDRPWYRRRRLVPLAILLAGGLAVALYLVLRPAPTFRLKEDSVGVFDGASGQRLGEIDVGRTPVEAAVGLGAIWVSNFDGNTVSRVDLRTLHVVQTIDVGTGPSGIAVGGGAVWVANQLDGSVSWIDPATNHVVKRIPVGASPTGVAFGQGAVWVANTADWNVSRIDPSRGRVTTTIPLEIRPRSLAAGASGLWVTSDSDASVVQIDPTALAAVQRVGVGNQPAGIALGAGAVWVANAQDGTVSRIDPRRGRVVATIEVADGVTGLAVAKGAVWVSSESDGTVARIIPAENRVERQVVVGSAPRGVAFGGGRIFVTNDAPAASHRGGILRLIALRDLYDIDPAHLATEEGWSMEAVVRDGLVGYARTAGPDHATLVPDLAERLPAPADGGRTFVFTLRSGIRYSDGERLRASDFRRAIGRILRLNLPAASYYSQISGAAQCLAQPKRCDLTRGIVTDDKAGTVGFHLDAPDPEFLYKLALPYASAVPSGTPASLALTTPIPGTGPYVIERYLPGRELRLIRNRRFRQWSAVAQPDGNADEIVWQIGPARTASIEAVKRGTVDEIRLQEGSLEDLQTRYGAQLHPDEAAALVYYFLNTRVSPFNRLDVRRAVNYGLDRARVARIFGGPEFAEPTCQITPRSLPGFRPVCPYSRDPRSQVWSGPDLAKADQLVERSGTKGARVVVWVPSAATGGQGRSAAIPLVSLLERLGFRATLKEVTLKQYIAAVASPASRVQAGSADWIADYPVPSAFFSPLLSCASLHGAAQTINLSGFCDPAIDADVARALALQQFDSRAANRLWADIDRRVVDQAPLAPEVDNRLVRFVSKRLGNYRAHPVYGLLVAQVWVK